jgi:3-dehydroquinate dehydratase-2
VSTARVVVLMEILVLNGPNLNLLGTRQPTVYGDKTLSDLEELIQEWGASLGAEISSRQSNHEGELIDAIQSTRADGLVFNPGALTHTSRALADAIGSIEIPTVEVHISNIKKRESWRSDSVISEACVLTIYGRGLPGYQDAIRHLVNRAALPARTVRYGPHDDNIGDVRGAGPRLAILIHGGIWRDEYTRDGTESLSVDLAVRGYTTWNIEYRRLGTGGGWPGSAHDVLMALDFAPQLWPGTPIDVIGHSAGAHLGIWAVSRSHSPIRQNVALAPIVDLRDAVESGGLLAPEAHKLLEGGAPDRVATGGVPTVLTHGTADEIVPSRHSVGLAEREGLELFQTGSGHFELLDPTKPEWDWVRGRLSQ